MQKITISIACSIGLHGLLLLYWYNQQTSSPVDVNRLEARTEALSEPIRFTLQPNPERISEAEKQPVEQINNTAETTEASRTSETVIQQEQPSPTDIAETPVFLPEPNEAQRPAEGQQVIEGISLEEVRPTTQPKAGNPGQITMPDLFSLRQHIQQHATQNPIDIQQTEACQRSRAMQGMPVTCQSQRYAASITEEEEMSLATQTQTRLARLLDGPAPVQSASDSDTRDTGNRVEANINIVRDQLQGDQLRRSVMNQP